MTNESCHSTMEGPALSLAVLCGTKGDCHKPLEGAIGPAWQFHAIFAASQYYRHWIVMDSLWKRRTAARRAI